MAAALLLGLTAFVATSGSQAERPLSILNGMTAVPIGQENWIDPIGDSPPPARGASCRAAPSSRGSSSTGRGGRRAAWCWKAGT